MNIKHHEIAIPKDTPFVNCKLQREPYAKVLTEIVGTFADGFVLAINNEWGTGKTTFAKMWMQSLSNDGFQTVYFNAWENDFIDDPLVAIMAELKPLIKGKVDGEKLFKSVLEKGAVLTKTVAPALLMSLIKKHVVDTVPLEEAIKNVTEATAGILEEQIREYSDKKKTVAEFRKEL
jgi:predicted KAP-like P-loop ATPase